jgi:hypothetical protein
MADAEMAGELPIAHVCIVQGDLPRRFTFSADRPARLAVGSAADAGLRLARADVAPRQFEIAWDGRALWLQDALRLGRTFVNGRPLNGWVLIDQHTVVSFAAVRLWVYAPRMAAVACTPDFAALERARMTDAHETSAQRRGDTGRITIPPELLLLWNEAGGRRC